MNKLFKKILGTTLGLSMAIGVGIAVANNSEAVPVHAAGNWNSVASISAGDVVVFAFEGTVGGKAVKKELTGVTTTGTTIGTATDYETAGSPNATFPLTVVAGNSSNSFAFKTTSNTYLSWSSGNSLTTATSVTSASSWTLPASPAAGSIKLTNVGTTGRLMQYNTGSPRWACYTSSQSGFIIYKQAGTSYTTTVDVTGGAKSTTNTSTSFSSSTTSGNVYLTPSSGYRIPISGLSSAFTISSGTATISSISDNGDGDVRIALTGVSTNFTIGGSFESIPTHTVTYVKGDHGSGSNYVVSSQPEGSYTLVSLATAGFTADSGYGFKKWNVGGTEYDPGDSITLSADTTVMAVWAEVVTLTYDKNGGTGTNSSSQVAKGSTVTVAANSFTAPSGKEFSKWNTKSNGTGTSYVKDDTFTINADTTLYAQWAPALDITISNFTEITTNYTKVYTHEYTVATYNSTTTMDVEAYGVYNNSDGIQMNKDKGTYIKNTEALPTGAYITKIICEWTATGKNSPTIYVAKDAVASTSSTRLGTGSNTVTTQTFTVTNASTNKYNYFYFDGTTVTGACYLSHLTICYDFADEVSSISVNATQAQLTFTVGDTFTFAGSVTPTRLISGVGSATTENLTFKLGGTAITAGSYVFAKADHGKTLNVTYTENGISKNANAPYTVVVNYEAVTSISLNTTSTSIGLEGEIDLTATILSANANPAVAWAVSSEDLEEDTNYEYVSVGNEFTLSMVKGNEDTGTIVVTATATGYVDDSTTPDLRATCTITVAGAKSVSLSLDSMSGYAGSGTNHKASITATANNFSSPTYSWLVVSETVSDMVTFSASTSATTYVNFVKAGTATIKCGVQEGGSGDYTYSDTITVAVASDAVSAVSWDAEDLTCYSGVTLSTSTITEWDPTYTMSSGDSGSITSDYVVKLNGTAYTFGTPLVAGTYTVTLTYGGQTTSVNPTLTVIQRLNTIDAASVSNLTFTAAYGSGPATADDSASWTVSSDGTESSFDSDKGIHYGTNGASVQYITLTSNSFTSGKITKVVVNASTAKDVSATVSVTVGGNAFGGEAKSLTTDATDYEFTGNASAGTIVVTITKPSSAVKAIYCKSVKVTSTGNVANSMSHYNAQAAVVEFAQYMNEQMNGTDVCSGTGANLSTAWGKVTSKYNTLFGDGSSLSSSELAFAKEMLANASANWNESHDSDEQYCLERAMKTYEWCVTHYSSTCTAFMSAVRPLEAARTISVININNNPNIPIIIAVISVIALTAVGGYYYLKHQKGKKEKDI